jgi:hypothetical protein
MAGMLTPPTAPKKTSFGLVVASILIAPVAAAVFLVGTLYGAIKPTIISPLPSDRIFASPIPSPTIRPTPTQSPFEYPTDAPSPVFYMK